MSLSVTVIVTWCDHFLSVVVLLCVGDWLLWLCRQCPCCCGTTPQSHLSNGVIGGWSIDPETTLCVEVDTFSFNYVNGLCYIVNTTELQPEWLSIW